MVWQGLLMVWASQQLPLKVPELSLSNRRGLGAMGGGRRALGLVNYWANGSSRALFSELYNCDPFFNEWQHWCGRISEHSDNKRKRCWRGGGLVPGVRCRVLRFAECMKW